MKSLIMLLIACLTGFMHHNLSAQNWERLYTPGYAADLAQTPDGGFIMVGEHGIWEDADKAVIIKTDAEGDVEWSRRYAVGDTLEQYTTLTVSNPYIIAAGVYTRISDMIFMPFLHRLDAQGNLVKEVKLSLAPGLNFDIFPSDLLEITPGTFWMSTYQGKIFVFNSDLDQTNIFNMPGKIYQMLLLPTGNILICGDKNNNTYIAELGPNGTLVWENTYSSTAATMALCQDGNIALATNSHILKIEPDGDLLWIKTNIPTYWQEIPWIVEDQNGNLLTTGNTNANFTLAFTLGKFDADGNLIWAKTPHQSMQGTSSGAKPLITSDGGYALAGRRAGKIMLIRSTPEFDLYRSWIAGTMYHDQNDNCIQDNSEYALKYFTVSILDDNGTEWNEYITNGQYAVQVPAGNYTVSINKRPRDPENWESCPGHQVVVNAQTDTAHIPAIGMKSLVDCPRPTIWAGINKMRHCAENTYVLHYFNTGTQMATDARIEVELPAALTYVSCNLPLVAQNGQILTFDAGNLDIDESGTAYLKVFCDCNTAVGDIACSSFHILPDSCYTTLPDWDHSIIKITATSDPGNVYFTLENVGTGDMSGPLDYIMRAYCTFLGDSGEFQLEAGESQVFTYPNNSLAYFFEAEHIATQPYIPGNAVMLWQGQSGNIEQGWWHTETGSPFYDSQCETIVNSFDPNDITVSPRGDSDDHFILATEPALNYRIRFQNTGTDTAFVVSIRDTLPAYLELASVVPGPSSHPYTFDMHQNTLKFLFKDINLPDSSANLELSQGFVEFKVKLKSNLPVGTRIDNRAAIFFDLNEPVITNTAFNTIHERVMVSVELDQPSPVQVKVAPNPAIDYAVFQLPSEASGRIYLSDAHGRLVKNQDFNGSSFQVDCQGLPAGTYYFNIAITGGLPVQGKMVVTPR